MKAVARVTHVHKTSVNMVAGARALILGTVRGRDTFSSLLERTRLQQRLAWEAAEHE